MSRKLNIEVKFHYGTMHLYPKCPESEFLCKIAGTKTLSESNITLAKSNGYTVEYTYHAMGELP